MRKWSLAYGLVALALFCMPRLSVAQGLPDSARVEIEKLKRELQEARRDLDELKRSYENPDAVQQEDLDKLEARLEDKLRELENKIDAVSRAYSPIAFNPRTTAFINVAGRVDNETVLDAGGESEIQNRPFLRTVELDLRAPVDPFAEAVTIISLEDEAGKGFAIDAEEAYGLIKRIPVLETAPLGMKIKVGKFRAPFGVNNKLHMHDLPWTTRPIAVSKYLGTEHGEFFESGFNPIGIDFDFFLPNPSSSSTLEMNLDVVRAGDMGLSLGNLGRQPAFLAHLNWSQDWANEHLLILGLSAYHERGPLRTRLYGADITYKWSPAERRDRNSFVLGGELLFGENNLRDEINPDLITRNRPFGWFAYAQYQLSWWVYLGGRYEEVEEPINDAFKTKAIAAYLSYYTTEFLRFRVGIENRKSDLLPVKSVTSGLFEINFVFGSHPTEPYWVSR
jgi:hypothetical protein